MPKDFSEKQAIGFINTPPLWVGKEFGLEQFSLLNLNLSSLDHLAIPSNRRLGHQMEYVFKHLIKQSQQFELILSNIAIRDEKQTLGEIDFILKNRTNQNYLHVELSYKFYLFQPTVKEIAHQLIGPNRQDMFVKKLHKLKTKQLPLIHSKIASKILLEHNINTLEIKQFCCFKAQVYTPYRAKLPEAFTFNKACILGYWLGINDFNQNDFGAHKFYIPSKAEWVIVPHTNVSWKSFEETKTCIKLALEAKRAPLVWMKKADKRIDQFFIVWW